HAAKAGAVHRALITFTFNRVSQALYIRHGLFPRLPLYMVGAPRDGALARAPETRLQSVRIEDPSAHRGALEAADISALAVSRAKHDRYLLGEAGTKGFLLHQHGACVGYTYFNAVGHIGPLAVTRPDAVGPAFATAMQLAGERAAQVSAFVPGSSEDALKIAMTSGMRITFPMVLMSSGPFGDWTRYLPRNPGFM